MQLHFEITNPETEGAVKKLIEKAGSSAELLRRAFATFDLIQENQEAGGKVIIRSEDGTEEVLKDVWD